MNNINILIILSVISCFFAVFGIILSVIAMIKVTALEKATHTVTYMNPVDKDWASSDKEINELNKDYSEEVEDITNIVGI